MIDKVPARPRCGNSRSNLPREFVLAIFLGSVLSGSTFAQTRANDVPTRPLGNGTTSAIKTAAGNPSGNVPLERMIRFRLTDPNGLPVAGAKVGSPLEVGPEMPERGLTSVRLSDENGEVLLDISDASHRELRSPDDMKEIVAKKLPPRAVYALHQKRKLGAIQGIRNSDGGRTLQVRLKPLCRVHGTLSGPDLPAATLLSQTAARVKWQAIEVLHQFSARQRFDFPLPPGEYILEFEGYRQEDTYADSIRLSTLPETLPVRIADGAQDVDLGEVELRPTPMAAMNLEAPAGPSTGDKILWRLVDPHGRPVAGAKVVESMPGGEPSMPGSAFEWSRAAGTSDEDGQISLEANKLFLGRFSQPAVYVLHEGRGLGAVQEVIQGGPNEIVPVALKPTCRVHGTLGSTGLAAIGMSLRRTGIIVASGRYNLFHYVGSDQRHDFDFPLPPGMYRLALSGTGAKEKGPLGITGTTELKRLVALISEGQRDLDLGAIDLRPTKIAALIGRPAPEIGPMKAWKNGSAVTLTELRGQVVWLHFDGSYPTGLAGLSGLAHLHEVLGDKGLTLIAISSSSSLEELEQKSGRMDLQSGGVPPVPFRIAIDGGAGPLYKGIIRMPRGVTHEQYDVMTPTDVLIDRAGNIVGEPVLSRAKEVVSQMLGLKENARPPSQ